MSLITVVQTVAIVCPLFQVKDSFYASHILRTKYGMHPLTVTWSPHGYTECIQLSAMIHVGHDNYLMTLNGRVHRLLTRLAVDNLFHPFQPFMFNKRHSPKWP